MDIIDIKNEHEKALFRKENVVGVGIGCRDQSEECIAVFVETKKPECALADRDIVPREVGGVKTDVVEVGELWALGMVPALQAVYGDRYQPTPPGVSLGHVDVTAGTFGCVVARDDDLLILSNNHVLACSNRARLGDAILQPGPHDGGTYKIAELMDFVPIRFVESGISCAVVHWITRMANRAAGWLGSSHRLTGYRLAEEFNRVDAAVAYPILEEDIVPGIKDIGIPSGIGLPQIGLPVQKTGRTTGHTQDTIKFIENTVKVQYGLFQSAIFTGQIIAGPMSAGGDSGSVVLDMDRNAIGLLFAGSSSVSIISPIVDVLDALDLELVVE